MPVVAAVIAGVGAIASAVSAGIKTAAAAKANEAAQAQAQANAAEAQRRSEEAARQQEAAAAETTRQADEATAVAAARAAEDKGMVESAYQERMTAAQEINRQTSFDVANIRREGERQLGGFTAGAGASGVKGASTEAVQKDIQGETNRYAGRRQEAGAEAYRSTTAQAAMAKSEALTSIDRGEQDVGRQVEHMRYQASQQTWDAAETKSQGAFQVQQYQNQANQLAADKPLLIAGGVMSGVGSLLQGAGSIAGLGAGADWWGGGGGEMTAAQFQAKTNNPYTVSSGKA